ncbi:MAG: 4-phosphoerythronate dehydrogenase [Tatlockia sp.]|nr:4-phosphoerythronate dehydrogenase [Tatlockia sp.]
MKILADASLPGLLHAFPKPFKLSLYQNIPELVSRLAGQEILLCRASLKVNQALLGQHSQTLRFIATASSGSDHIDEDYLKANAIKLIDAKGSNARAVADYVIATLAYLQTYKNISCVKAGVIGLGEVGLKVAKRLKAIGMNVLYNDPLKAESDINFLNSPIEDLIDCDLICLHPSLHDNPPFPSRNLIDKILLNRLKPGAVMINASRGDIVNEDLILNQNNKLIYCTDVYSNEPSINKKIVEWATICTPHIAGHSVEAKFTAVAMISETLHRHLNLKPPAREFPLIKEPSVSLSSGWQDLVLSLYNPFTETQLLKSATNLELSFKSLRLAHQNRHDFCNYSIQSSSKQTKKILGVED